MDIGVILGIVWVVAIIIFTVVVLWVARAGGRRGR
jgi:hypothetical protein